MNSVSPSAAQYVGGMMQDDLVGSRRQQPLERQGSFGLRTPQATDSGREATGEPDEMDKLKAKLMSAWNNVKYGSCLGLKNNPMGASVLYIRVYFIKPKLKARFDSQKRCDGNLSGTFTILHIS